MKSNGSGIKSKVKSKVKVATKQKVKGKCKGCKCAELVTLLALLCGCSTSEPASRLNKAEYGDIVIRLDRYANHNTVTLTVGDGALSSNDSDGATETVNASPTNDVKPTTTATVPVATDGGAASTAASAAGSLVQKIADTISGNGSNNGNTTAAQPTASPVTDAAK